MAQLTLSRLTKRFGPAVAVDSVDLDVRDGQFVSLLGPSGCGKTTTLRMIAGFVPPDAGEIHVAGKVVSQPGYVLPPDRRNMSMIFQSYAVWPHMTVLENIAYGLKCRGAPRAEITVKVRDILRIVRLGDFIQRYPWELSGGQQQRVALARALVVQPETLLLDEPLSNLDADLREQMRFEIRRLHDEFGITTVYVTHDQAEAMVTSDRIAVMNRGRIEQVGTPEEIYEHPRTPFVAGFIGLSNILECRIDGHRALLPGATLILTPSEANRAGGAGIVKLSIRPHVIELGSADLYVPAGFNALRGCVERHAYLGHFRDYIVSIENSTIKLRVLTLSTVRHKVGDGVTLRIAPEDCRVLLA